jgi:hypothetical protein
MAKGEAKTTNTAIDQARKQTQQFQTQFGNTMQQRGDVAYGQDQGLKDTMTQGYTSMANTGGITPEQEARLRGLYTNLNTGGGGGYSAPSYSLQGNTGDVLSSYTDLMNGGGVNRYALGTLQDLSNARGGLSDELWNPIQKSIGGFQTIGDTGGYSPEDKARIQANIDAIRGTGTLNPEMMAKFGEGLGGFSEFARTGGISDQQARDIMARGTSVIPSYYGQMRNDLNTNTRIQGGYNPGLAASARNLARDQASAAQAAARDTRLGLADTVNKGRLAGFEGLTTQGLAGAQAMSDAEYRALTGNVAADQGLQQAIIENKLAGLTGAGSTSNQLANIVSGNRLGASNALNDLTQIDLQAKLAGTQGVFGVKSAYADEAARNAAAASAAAEQNYQNNLAMAKFGAGIEQYLIDSSNQNKLAGLGGLGNVYTSTPGETSMYYDNQLKNQQLTGGQVQDNLALRAQYNPNVSTWDRVMQGIQAGTGIAGAFMGGLGGFGGGSNSGVPLGGTTYAGEWAGNQWIPYGG